MRPVLFLRIASVLTLIHAVLHTVGGVFGAPAPGPQLAVVEAMKAHEFLVMGVMRSYWDFRMGMGLAVSVLLTAEAIVFWQLGSLAKTEALGLRPMLTTFLVGYVGLAAVSYRCFFWAPVITEILIAGCLGAAVVSCRQERALEPAVLRGGSAAGR
jgi:hypothetical protein